MKLHSHNSWEHDLGERRFDLFLINTRQEHI